MTRCGQEKYFARIDENETNSMGALGTLGLGDLTYVGCQEGKDPFRHPRGLYTWVSTDNCGKQRH